MAYRVHIAPDIDSVLTGYGDIFLNKGQLSDLGTPILCVVQNKNLEHWLKLRLVDHFGISAGIEFMTPDMAVRRLLPHFPDFADAGYVVPFADQQKLLVYDALKKAEAAGKLPAELAAGDEKTSDASLLVLAGQLGRHFYEYGTNYSDLIINWTHKQTLGLPGGEDWQSQIWWPLFNSDDGFRTLNQLNQALDAESYAGPAYKIILLGSAFLNEASLHFFAALGQILEVEHFFVRPAIAADGRSSPLFAGWGVLLNEQTAQIGELGVLWSDVKTKPPAGEPTDLNRLQAQITTVSENELTGDGTVRFGAAATAAREIEIIHDRILDSLAADPDLRLTEIGIMAPDINSYVPFIDAVFGSSANPDLELPFSIVDLAGDAGTGYLKGIFDILNLSKSRYTRDDLLRLIQNRCIATRLNLGIADVDMIESILEDADIQWGLDKSYRSERGLGEYSQSTWQQGLDRVWRGVFLPDRSLTDPDGFLPTVEISASETLEKFGEFVHFFRDLTGRLHRLEASERPMADWATEVRYFTENYLSTETPDAEHDERRIRTAIGQLTTAVREVGLEETKYSFEAFLYFFEEAVSGIGNHRGGYLTGGLTFASIKPLRSIPFKHIYILGMNGDSFPAIVPTVHFDLMRFKPESFTSVRRNWDNLSFLETLLAAREKLFISFQGTDPESGLPLEPSPVIKELWSEFKTDRDALKAGGILTEYPLYGWNRQNFASNERLTWNTKYFAIAEADVPEKKPAQRNYNRLPRTLKHGEELPLTFDGLWWFLQNPIRTFLRSRLQLTIPRFDLSGTNQETFDPRLFYQRDFLTEFTNSGFTDAAEYIRRLAELGRVHSGKLDFNTKPNLKNHCERLLKSKVAVGLDAGQRHDTVLLQNKVDLAGEGLFIYPEIKNEIRNTSDLSGMLPGCYRQNDIVHFFSVVESNEYRLANVAKSYLAALILAVHPQADYNSVNVHVYDMAEKTSATVPFKTGGEGEDNQFKALMTAYENNLSEIIPLSLKIGSSMLSKKTKRTPQEIWQSQLKKNDERHFDFVFKGDYPQELPAAAEAFFEGFIRPMDDKLGAAIS